MQVTQEHVKKNIRDKWFCNRGQRRCTWWKLARGNRRQSGWDDNKRWRARRMRGQNASKSNPAWAPKSRGDQTCRLFFFFLLLSLITFWRQANATRGNKINTSKKGYSLHTRGGKKKKRDLENTKWPKKKKRGGRNKEAHASSESVFNRHIYLQAASSECAVHCREKGTQRATLSEGHIYI